jgi:hypothetical protein
MGVLLMLLWQTDPKFSAERLKIGSLTVDQLVAHVNGLTGGFVANVQASQVRCTEGRLYRPGDQRYELDGDTVLPLNQRIPALSPAEIQRLNEALRRTKVAVAAGRDVMIGVASLTSLVPPLNQSSQLYQDYFGVFNQERARKVLKNFMQLCQALDAGGGPILFDHRNTDFGEDCYAACKGGDIVADVKIWLGRDFFSDGKSGGADFKAVVSRTTDATVGTMVHEFSHGVFNAVDCPPVNSDGSWRLTPDAVSWESPDNDVQASTQEMDKALAVKEPRAAIVNADSYGQFAVGAMNI